MSQAFDIVGQESIRPVFEAGLVDLVESNHVICPEVSLLPTFGHSPGHVSVRISSSGEEALITGDFVHHPSQFARPHWNSAFDHDPREACCTRRHMFELLAGTPTLVIGTHFADPTAGHVIRDGAAYRFQV